MRFYPSRFVKKALGKGFFKGRIIDDDLKFRNAEIASVLKSDAVSDVVTKTKLSETVSGVIRSYKRKIARSEDPEATKKLILKDQDLVKQRIENLVVFNEVNKIKSENEGEFYRWLPSSANTPDPEHQLLYGKIFPVGQGDDSGNMPGERYGCQCGMEILETKPEEEE